jgi:hypothetical protein
MMTMTCNLGHLFSFPSSHLNSNRNAIASESLTYSHTWSNSTLSHIHNTTFNEKKTIQVSLNSSPTSLLFRYMLTFNFFLSDIFYLSTRLDSTRPLTVDSNDYVDWKSFLIETNNSALNKQEKYVTIYHLSNSIRSSFLELYRHWCENEIKIEKRKKKKRHDDDSLSHDWFVIITFWARNFKAWKTAFMKWFMMTLTLFAAFILPFSSLYYIVRL